MRMFMNQINKKRVCLKLNQMNIYTYIYIKKENPVCFILPLLCIVFLIFLKNLCKNIDRHDIGSHDRWRGPLLAAQVSPCLAKWMLDGL